jgi:acyl phosphate:glycerol-3-phosphate acyltransferase
MTDLTAAWLLPTCYLLGSLSGSLLLGKWRGVDIRTHGSGNAGGTNAFRTQGSRFALLVVLIDALKGAAHFGGAPWQTGGAVGAVVAGHIWPIFFGFRGGKGAATYLGAGLTLAPFSAWPCLVVWLFTLFATGYVGLSTVLGCLAFPAALWWNGQGTLATSLALVSLADKVIVANDDNYALAA